MKPQRKTAEAAAEATLVAGRTTFSRTTSSYDPDFLSDLDTLQYMLHDLAYDLAADPVTARQYGHALVKLGQAGQAVAALGAMRPTRIELVDHLRSILQNLSALDDEVASLIEAVRKFGFKLQYLDLVTQLLTAMIVGVATGRDLDPVSLARLQNLRRCCDHVLAGNAAPMASFAGPAQQYDIKADPLWPVV